MNLLVTCGLAAGLGGTALGDNRTIDGTGNNLAVPSMGCLNSPLIRPAGGAYYSDGLGAPMDRGGARAISNALSAQTGAGLGNARNLSSWAWQWGQFIDHDFALVDEGTTESMPIPIPTGDTTFDPGAAGGVTMPFMRSVHTGGVVGPRVHSNALTHWIDGSMVYGSDATRAGTLRAPGGRLAMSAGNMLPYNTSGLPNGGGTSASLFVAGDIRANEQTGLLAIHTVFVREHNRLADQIASANPGWGDEQVYQRARKLVGAEIQAITYNEWLPSLLGPGAIAAYVGYQPSVDASMDTAFSTAAFRIGHTMLNDQLLRVNADGSAFAGGNLNLFQQFFNPASITGPSALDATVRGLAWQQANEVDTKVIDGVRNLLFGGTNGRDLVALNLQRGRDHGLPDYNTLRQDFGLPAVTSFGQITSDPTLAAALLTTYGSVNNIDPWIGLFSEDHMPGSSMGQTAMSMFADQFRRLRDGDRYFYLNDSDLTGADLALLGTLRLSDILAWNTGATELSGNLFFAIPAPGAAGLLGVGMCFVARRRRR